MNEIIKVSYEDADRPTVMGRELHKALGLKTPYHKWFARMCEYDFIEGEDFVTMDKKVRRADGTEMPQVEHNHQLTLSMAMKYATIAEMGNVESTQHFKELGAEKLYLLAKLDEPQREEIQQTVDLESTTVKELKEKIDSLKKANDRLMGKVEEAEKTAEKSRKSEEAACGKLSILQTAYEGRTDSLC